MILILSGADSYRSRKRLTVLIEAFKKKFDPKGYNISRFIGSNADFGSIQSAFSTMSFLGSKRLVVLEDFFTEKTSQNQKRVLEYLHDRDGDAHVIIFYQSGDLPGASSRLSFIKKAKHELFELLEGSALASWITREAGSRGLEFSMEAKRLFQERINGDLWIGTNVLDQLKALAASRKKGTISIDDVKQFTQISFDDNIFHLTDAIGKKQTQVALELLFDQLQSGSHPLYILTMLARQFRLLLQIVLEDGRATAESIGVHPYAFRNALAQSRYFSLEELRKAYKHLQMLDSDFKRGEKDAETAFTQFIVSLSKA